jgi:hypothetical protein
LQGSYIHRGRGLILTDNVGPGVEESPVPSAILAGREVVDVAGMPVCGRRDLRIRASAVVIDPRNDAPQGPRNTPRIETDASI